MDLSPMDYYNCYQNTIIPINVLKKSEKSTFNLGNLYIDEYS